MEEPGIILVRSAVKENTEDDVDGEGYEARD